MREWYGAFPDWGPLAEDSAAKLKSSQLNVCTVYAYCVQCTLFPPVAEICARLAGNFCQYMARVTSGAKSLVWVQLSAISQLASRVGEGGGVGQPCLHIVTQPYTTWPRWREQGRGLRSLPLGIIPK